jgi:hypothetical protein
VLFHMESREMGWYMINDSQISVATTGLHEQMAALIMYISCQMVAWNAIEATSLVANICIALYIVVLLFYCAMKTHLMYQFLRIM